MDSNQAREFFATGIANGNKRIAAFITLADHEFNSQVVQDEATGKWQVTKKVEETSLFDSEQEAIDWSTKPIGARPPTNPTPEPQDIERTPLKEPISTDEPSTPPSTESSSGTGLFADSSAQPESRPESYQEAASFEPTAKTKPAFSTVKLDKESYRLLSRNLREAGNDQLARKVEQIAEITEAAENLDSTREHARIYAQAYIDSLSNNRYATSNSYSLALSALQSNYNLPKQEAIQLLAELKFPQKLIPNYFE